MSTTKLLKEEVQTLKDLQKSENEITFALGQVEIKTTFLENQKQEIKNNFKTLLQEQDKVGKELQEKYGDGNINIEKGEFVSLK
tara:strand:+ start:302 stop:553 length:252 start_codon:yes stop_codon:yes gene_type:complete